jgi:hypothetical protein
MKLYNSLEVARQSVKNDKMMSAYMSEFVSFNVLDKDYVEAKLQKELDEIVDDDDMVDVNEVEVNEVEVVVPQQP